MRSYDDALSDKALQKITFQYGTAVRRYAAVASWRQIFKTIFYDIKEEDLATALYKSGHHAQIHYGLWRKNTKKFDDAIRNMSDYAFRSTFPHYTGKRIDFVHLGCGFGGCELRQAKKYPAFRSMGISLDRSQVETAKKLAILNDLSERVRFTRANFLDYKPSNPKSFDGGIAIESFCYVPRSQLDILWANTYSLLKRGARFTVLDWYLTRELTEDESQKLEVFLKGWDMPDCVNVSVMVDAAEKNGFELVDEEDITPKIIKSAKKIHFRAAIFKPIVWWAQGKNNYLETIGLAQSQTKDFVATSLIQYHLFKDGVITYRRITFKK